MRKLVMPTIADSCGRCSKCRVVKSVSEFYTQGMSKHLARWCKQCRREDERRRRADMGLVKKFHKRYETDESFRARELLRAIAKRCRRKNLAFDLDVQWLAERLRNGQCELTGLPFNMSVATRRPTPYTPSIDRIIPSNGYTKSNCRVVLHAVNLSMGNWGLDVLLEISQALLERHRKVGAA